MDMDSIYRTEREQLAWDMFFANLMAMQYHPGYKNHELTDQVIERTASIADAMILERRKRHARHMGSSS